MRKDLDNGTWTNIAYDAAGRELVRMNPLSQRTTMAYNDCGRQTVRIDARGNRTTYVYLCSCQPD